jgi:hypothetical protein
MSGFYCKPATTNLLKIKSHIEVHFNDLIGKLHD